MFFISCKKVLLSFTIISSIAATTRIRINNIRTNFLIKEALKQNNVQSLHEDWKKTLRWQKLKFFCTNLTNLDLHCNGFFPMNGSTHTKSFLGAKAYTFFSMKILFKNLLIQTSIKLQGYPFLLKMSLRLRIS